jgi:uncharacterized surface protein with fasciclin (FAS1) repeats
MKKIVPVALVAALLATIAVPAMAAPPGDTIVDVAKAINGETGEFSILILALEAADPAVINTLDGNGQFTVFAPTDAAFVSLLEELQVSAEDLLSDQELVTQVLLYHVAHGRRSSGDVLASDRIRTLQRGFLFQDGGMLTDNQDRSANIIGVDVEAANGIIHVIDRVVLP